MTGKGKGRASSSGSHSTWLPRGKACLNCRLRKIRCDGGLPICGPCRKDGRDVDCEYSGDTPSSTVRLEQKVTDLRARLRDLERARLHSERAGPVPSVVTAASSTTEGTAHYSTSSPEQGLRPTRTAELGVGPVDFTLSEADTDTLLDLFFEQEQPLWFLHRARFRNAVRRPLEDPHRAHSALISVVCAIATRYANPELAWLESGLTDISLSAVNTALNTGGVGYEENVLHLLQARVLLGGVLAQTGRTLQSATILEGACALALALGLHGSNEQTATTPLGVMDPIAQQSLPSPTDNVSRAERAGAFWITAALEAIWAIARGSPPRVGFLRYHITTPWPVTPEVAEDFQFNMLSSARGPQAVRSFLDGGGPPPTWTGDNAVELIISAAYLLANSSTLARSMPAEDAPEAVVIEARADAFTLALGPTLLADVQTHPAQVLVRGVTLELHTNPGDLRAVNAARALAAAAPALLSPSLTPGFLEPAIGMVVPAACRALISARSAAATDESLQDIESMLNTLQGILEAWAPRNAYISVQLERVQQERTSAL